MEASAAAAAAGTSDVFLRRGPVGRRTEGRRPAMVGFSDQGHLRYYASVRCGIKKEKKREKLVEGLRRDLVEFSSMGFGEGMVGEVKGKMISEAADVLLAQLTQLRAEAKEMKRRKKQEKAAMKAAKRNDVEDDSSSSSSSSESSDSECETTPKMTSITAPEIHQDPIAPKLLTTVADDQLGENTTLKLESNIEVAVAKALDNKIEVCMGGKCKKSGATELLAEFDRKVGIEGVVVGCKCMGKCKEGPNVRVVNRGNAEEVVKAAKGPLCIGVGLEDVGSIVANFFGENKDVGFAAA